MSMNFQLAFVPDTEPSAFGPAAAEAVTLDEALSDDAGRPSAAQAGPHALLVSPDYDLESVLERSSPVDGTIISSLGGVADTYMFEVVGPTRRVRSATVGELEEEGPPHPLESVFVEVSDIEDAHLEVICRAAGISATQLWELGWRAI